MKFFVVLLFVLIGTGSAWAQEDAAVSAGNQDLEATVAKRDFDPKNPNCRCLEAVSDPLLTDDTNGDLAKVNDIMRADKQKANDLGKPKTDQ